MMNELRNLPNIGKVAEKNLIEAGIENPQKLTNLGSKAAFVRIKSSDPSAWINVLYALEGAIQGLKRHDLSDETKSDLKAFYKSL